MLSLSLRLREALNSARKARNKPLTLVLGTVLADIENHHTSVQRDLTDADVTDVLRKAIKRRRESLEAFEKGGRTELAAQEREEIRVLDACPATRSSTRANSSTVSACSPDFTPTLPAPLGRYD